MEFSPKEILLFLHRLRGRMQEFRPGGFARHVVRIGRGGTNGFWIEDDIAWLMIPDLSCLPEAIASGEKPEIDLTLLPLPTKNVRLGFACLAGDRRWESVKLPSTLLFLAGPLHAAGFFVEVEPLDAKFANPFDDKSTNVLGMTVYEEHLPRWIEYFDRLQSTFGGLIAVGGPMVTLAPMASIYHLSSVHLFVRGEADTALPRILAAIGRGDSDALFAEKGIAFRWGGRWILSAFDQVIRPFGRELSARPFSSDFMQRGHLECGIEVNLTRGCSQGCLFCSRVHGRTQRRFSPGAVKSLLEGFKAQRKKWGLETEVSRTININDDDILQDEAHARAVFGIVKEQGLKIWGVQTSLASLVDSRGRVPSRLLETLADPDLYAEGKPLLWIGTDLFLAGRCRRLGKSFPPQHGMERLFSFFEEKAVNHFHYWISSDAESGWSEIVAEIECIVSYFRRFRCFGLLPHAPFLVPYASTPIYNRLVRSGKSARIKIAGQLRAIDPVFSYPLVSCVETRHENLNRMLKNEKVPFGAGAMGFIDCLKKKEIPPLLNILYHFLRQDRFQAEAAKDRGLVEALVAAEERLQELMSEQ